MDFLKDILGSQAGDMVSALVEKGGFSAEQAQAFVPEAGKSVFKTVQGNMDKFDLSDLTSESNQQNILSSLPIADLAGKVGISEGMVQTGLTTVMPMVLNLLKNNEGLSGILSMADQLGGLGQAKDLLGGLGGMFGK